jgi:hypothetical protein
MSEEIRPNYSKWPEALRTAADLAEGLRHEIKNWDIDPELLAHAFVIASSKILAELSAKV